MTVEDILKERGKNYGSFQENARVSQLLKTIVHSLRTWHNLAPDQKEAVEMIFFKISRIVTGDPNYPDNWHDISGYSQLIETRLKPQLPTACNVQDRMSVNLGKI